MRSKYWTGLIALLVCGVLLSTGGMFAGAQGGPLAPEGVFGETYYAPFPVAIELDGEFDDWDGVPTVYLDRGVGGPAITFGAAADGEFLYFYADIVDDNIISGEHGTDYWNEDSVELYINATGDLTLRSYTDGVAQITIPALNRGLPMDEVVLAGVRGDTAEAQVVAVETNNGWALELSVPLENSVWSIEPEQDAEIGFQVHLNAASELNRDTKLIWSVFDPGDQSYQNPSLFGRLIFYETSNALPVASGVYQFTSMLDDDGMVDDFEGGIWLDYDDDSPIGLTPLGDSGAETLSLRQVLPETALALPDQDDDINYVLAVSGGYAHAFTDGYAAVAQDWSAYNALGFWLYGTGSGGDIVTGIQQAGDAVGAASLTTTLADDFSGWQHVIVPFSLFGTDALAEVAGYSFTFPEGDVYVDNVRLFNVENTRAVITGDSEPRGLLILDQTIGWDTRDWELVWSDEFEGEMSTPINTENWTCETGGEGWGNNELEYYTQSTDNVSLDGEGNLAIVARQENPENYTCWYGQCAYTSARCITWDKFEVQYGRVEARIRVPFGQGIWPAFWMLGANFGEVGWPDSGEIDIMENVGFEPYTAHGTVHGPGYSGASGIGGGITLDEPLADDFHVFAIDWDPYVIRWYLDGTLFSTVSVNDTRNREWVFDHPFFLLLNVAVGGSWPGFPDDTTTFPQTMLVDYVRVYQLAGD